MANVQVDATADIAIGQRVVIRDSNDRVYVFVNAGGNIRAYKGNITGEPASFAEQDAVGAPNGADFVGIAAAIDSTGLIHVMYYFDDTVAMQASPNIRYAQFRSSAHAITQDDWVLINEEISVMTNADGDFTFTHFLGIVIDANDDPHATWSDEITNMGKMLETIFYDNRIGGTWGGRIEVQRVSETAQINIGLDIMIADPASSVNADRPIIVISSDDLSNLEIDAFHGTTLNATAFTKSVDVTGSIVPNATVQRGKISIAIDSNEKITVTFIENTSNDLMIVEHLNSNAWGTWETPVDIDTTRDYGNPSIAIDGTNRYIFVEHVNVNDIRLWKDVGAGFVEETADADLPNVGTFNDVKCKWASKNNNSPRELDYVFEDSGGAVQYNTFQGAAGAEAFERTASQTLTHSESIVRQGSTFNRVGITVLVHSSVENRQGSTLNRIGSTIFTHSEVITRLVQFPRTVAQSLIHSEVISRAGSTFNRIGTTILTHIDNALRQGSTFNRIGSTILTHLESIVSTLTLNRTAIQTIIHSESVSRAGSMFNRIGTTILTHIDTAIRQGSAFARVVADALIHSELVVAIKGTGAFERIASQILTHSEIVTRVSSGDSVEPKTPEFGSVRTPKRRISSLMVDGFNDVRILVRLRENKREHLVRILNTIYYPYGLGTPVTIIKSIKKIFENKVRIIKPLEKSHSSTVAINLRPIFNAGINKAKISIPLFNYGSQDILIKKKVFEKGMKDVRIIRSIMVEGENMVKVKSLPEILNEIDDER